jgi:putative ABC transport system substrate-binding protein
LLSYGPDLWENARRAPGYVAKILKGAKPADLPVQQPTKISARRQSEHREGDRLTIPPAILARADEVTE